MTELMQGFPPAPDAQVTLANWRTPPFNRWAFHHVRELLPTAEIANDPRRTRPLAVVARDLSSIRIESEAGRLDLDGYFERAEVDGFVVLYRGELIHESYFNGMDAAQPHICMSVSKSLLGLLAGVLAERGQLDTEAQASRYVPELQGTAFDGATVRQLLDMRTGVSFSEDYSEADGLYQRYRKAMGWNPLEPGDTPSDQRSFYREMTEREGAHGGPFRYISPCTDLLGWIIERAAGTRYADLMSELLWKPLGAEMPAYITLDRLGAPRAAGGMCVTTRDLARIGQMIVEGGAGIVATDWIEDISTMGDAEAWEAGDFAEDYPGMPMHYRAQWYVMRDRGPLIMALGIHGQNLYVDRGTELVVAKHASAAAPLDPTGERLTLKMFEAIRDLLC
jgi:CubicO group peptidase (beta-lactamase class C family)